MRVDRRRVLAVGCGAAALAALLVVDPFGIADAIAEWLAVARPVDGSVDATLDAAVERRARVRRFGVLLARDPLVSVAVGATGLGIGLIGGAIAAFVSQRRRVRRGGWGE